MIIDVLEQWRVWRHRIDRVRIALPQGYTTACIWVCIPFFFVVRILVCGDFDRVFIPHVLTYFGFGGHNSYSYTVLFTRAQHENNTKSRLPTLEDEKLRIFRVFQTIYVSLYTSKVTFPCIQRKSMCFSRNVSLPRLRPTYFRSVPSLSAQKKTELAKRGLDPMLRSQKITRNGQQRIRSHVQDPPAAVELYRYL